jgi:hypothetical protein
MRADKTVCPYRSENHSQVVFTAGLRWWLPAYGPAFPKRQLLSKDPTLWYGNPTATCPDQRILSIWLDFGVFCLISDKLRITQLRQT